MHIKNFEGWGKLKERIDTYRTIPIFHEREIWWCSIGMNIGYEIYGKGDIFTRPVLIIKKFSPFTFLCLPLSTKLKTNEYYYPITFNGETRRVIFDQAKTLDGRRLAEFIARLPENQFDKIKKAFLSKLSE